MTVRDWLAHHTQAAPRALVDAMIDALGEGADEPEQRTAAACLAAAARALERLVTDQRQGRETAIDLLAIDALATLAYEHSAETSATADALADTAARDIRALSASALARV